MRFFVALAPNRETFVLKAETWFAARNIARRLYPFEDMEKNWEQMTLLEDPPPLEHSYGEVYEMNKEIGAPRLAPEYQTRPIPKEKRKTKGR